MPKPALCRRALFSHATIEGGCGCPFGECRAAGHDGGRAAHGPMKPGRRLAATAAVAALALSVAACQTTANYKKFTDTMVGQSESQVMLALGEPSKIIKLPDGGKMLIYVQSASYVTPAQSTYNSGKSVNIFTGKKSGYVSNYTYTPESTVNLSCETRISIHRGHVDGVVFNGNYCVR